MGGLPVPMGLVLPTRRQPARRPVSPFEDFARSDAYSDLVVTSNELLPDPRCLARCSHGGWCSELRDHDGPHNSDGHCQWEGDDAAV